jgi:MscS family membrane protein
MRKDYFHVYFNNFGASSLDILVYVFWETPDWATELRERHRFLLDSLRLAHRLGVSFAYPTQTLYLQRGDGGPPTPEQLAQLQAFAQGQDQARAVVATSGSGGERRPPVSFP